MGVVEMTEQPDTALGVVFGFVVAFVATSIYCGESKATNELLLSQVASEETTPPLLWQQEDETTSRHRVTINKLVNHEISAIPSCHT